MKNVQPVFVSQGHRISLPRAIELTLAVTDRYRVPRPTREADRWVKSVRKEAGEPAPKPLKP